MTQQSDKGRGYGRITLALVVVAALSACQPLYRDHGYAPSDDALADIIVGVDTRETVSSSVGSPSSSGVLRESGYYYISQRTLTRGARATEVVDRQVVAISFDGQGVVQNIERFSLQDGKAVALSRPRHRQQRRGAVVFPAVGWIRGQFRCRQLPEQRQLNPVPRGRGRQV